MSNASTPAAASAPPRPQGSPPLVMSRVQRALHNLADDKFNLASDDLVSHVAWFTTGTGLDVLIEKRTTSEDDGDDDVVEAALKCIAMVDPVENWFYVCGGWTGQNNIQVVKPPVGMPSSPSKRRAVVEESSNERKQKKKKGLAAAS
ncbi:hypothetical protein FOMPIDRAFT_1024839, partial [Fomitopsis schrenkii]